MILWIYELATNNGYGGFDMQSLLYTTTDIAMKKFHKNDMDDSVMVRDHFFTSVFIDHSWWVCGS